MRTGEGTLRVHKRNAEIVHPATPRNARTYRMDRRQGRRHGSDLHHITTVQAHLHTSLSTPDDLPVLWHCLRTLRKRPVSPTNLLHQVTVSDEEELLVRSENARRLRQKRDDWLPRRHRSPYDQTTTVHQVCAHVHTKYLAMRRRSLSTTLRPVLDLGW